MAAVIFVTLFAAYLLWLCGIRPYCLRKGKGYTTGANMAVAVWVDWQEAKELAKEDKDQGMIAICRAFLWLHILAVAVVFCLVIFSFTQ